MKTIRWIALTAIALGAAGLVLARAEVGRKPDEDSEVRALRQQVEQLQARVKTLEERLAKVESSKAASPAPRIEILPRSPGAPPAMVIPPQSPVPGRSGQQPKILGQGEINGWPFYFIPCGGK